MKTLKVHSTVREFRAAQRRLFAAGRRYTSARDGVLGCTKSAIDLEDAEDALQDAAVDFAFAAAAYAESATYGGGRGVKRPTEGKS